VHFHYTPTRPPLTQPDQDLVLHPAGPVPFRRLLHRAQTSPRTICPQASDHTEMALMEAGIE
jgi:hypothetical protein